VNVVDVVDVVDVVGEVALVVDVDVDYEDVDFDSVVELELVESYIVIQTKNISKRKVTHITICINMH
jgi:hypothetical protein